MLDWPEGAPAVCADDVMKDRTRFLAAEGVLIVVSILVAFAIDAWWDERRDRVEERRVLESLKTEFLTNANNIPWYIERHRRTADHSRELIRAMHSAGPGGTVGIRNSHLDWVLEHNSTDPQRGALDAVLLSGELRCIRNPQIRDRLADWPQLVEDATENEILLRNTWGPLLAAALYEGAATAALVEIDPACWNDDSQEACRIEESSLPYSTKVIGFLRPVSGYSAEAARELAVLAEEAEEIVALIDRELDAS